MDTFAHRHAGTARAGGVVWIGGGAYGDGWGTPRGHAQVRHDGQTWFYRVKRGERRAFRAWAAQAWQAGCETVRVTGAWPHYSIERSA